MLNGSKRWIYNINGKQTKCMSCTHWNLYEFLINEIPRANVICIILKFTLTITRNAKQQKNSKHSVLHDFKNVYLILIYTLSATVYLRKM